MTEETTELVLPSRIEAIEEAAAAVAEFVSRSGVKPEVVFGVDMAVREAITNAVLHGNRQDESKVVEIHCASSATRLEITVRDRGEGFNPDCVPDPTDPQNLMKSSGRGILFMRTFMDEVGWSHHPRGGTVVRMVKNK